MLLKLLDKGGGGKGNAFVWIVGGNLIGLVFGWLSIKVTTLGAKPAATVSD